jgi:DeoR/GlpR family transcriptional regulator of sugar metabolism
MKNHQTGRDQEAINMKSTLPPQSNGVHNAQPRAIPTSPTWVTYSSDVQPKLKRALAHYAAFHLIKYGNMLLIGSGTTLNSLMDEIIGRHIQEKKAFDLIILTSNLQVMAKGRDAQLGMSRDAQSGRGKSQNQPAATNLFSEMQTILTGGTLRSSLDSLTGQYAARGVNNEEIYPDWVFFGAAGLSFRNKQLTIRYHFQDEIATQEAYATRPTEHRVILCDHTKLGTKSGLKADLTIDSLIETAERCTIITTMPEESSGEFHRVQTEIEAFKELLLDLVSRRPDYVDRVALRLVDLEGNVTQDITVRSALKSRDRE